MSVGIRGDADAGVSGLFSFGVDHDTEWKGQYPGE
jgi:hypothetical protein